MKQKHYRNVTTDFIRRLTRLDITFLEIDSEESDFLWKRHNNLRLHVRNDGR